MQTPQSIFFKSLQEEISNSLAKIQGTPFRQDIWKRDEGGGGDTRIFLDGEFLEKGGVNFSEVFGKFSPEFAEKIPYGEGLDFYATGISLVLHPKNPFVPTVHANFRYLKRGSAAWYGGGADLTPYYLFEEDAIHFHKTYANTLNAFSKDLYPKFKATCDEYFYLPHRAETRGVGGIFFDYQLEGTAFDSKQPVFEMSKACGNSFLNSYLPIVEKRLHLPFTEENKTFQEYRRGRYVEFNLLYDRGTIFGLKTNGRIESILMSLPLKARWEYDYQTKPGSPEAALANYLKPRDWINSLGD
ncbi:MAG: oxygen-dependent coproporphyrinogen oxidase [Bdellovibrionota bacterium]